ncbi:MAG: dipeptidase PepE [Candidatus Polarisedimenticolia bacterium]
MRLLLLSNSSNYGQGYLAHAAGEITGLYGKAGTVLFVPFALHDQAAYTRRAADRLAELGYRVEPLVEGPDAPAAVARAEAIFVGGGNTFRLLDRLQRCGALEAIRRAARKGTPYMGASAGTVIAGPTIRTTNDMPIVEPVSLDALGLVSFQINCHYLDADPASRHMGETREERLTQFLEDNDVVVAGLREGAMLRIEDPDAGAARVHLAGTSGARIFRRGAPPAEAAPAAEITQLLRPS